MHIEITGLKFDLDDLGSNPGKEARVEEALFERFALPDSKRDFHFEGMDRKQSMYRAEFHAKPGVRLEAIDSWLNENGFHNCNVQGTLG